ncbi:MAG: MFS transporter [Candidatus Omnitrophica bacterium]|nr:MFS transporter [Candidatus Omnitrophota bacterium]
MSQFRKILTDKNFFFFWVGQIISQFGDRLNQMALIALVYQRLGGSAFGLAKVMSFTIIPSFILSPFAGAYVDRWNHKHTMIITDLIRAFLVILIPLCFFSAKSFIPIYITVFLVFSTSCFFLPSKFSIIPEIVDKDQLLIANSLINTTMMLAVVFGIGLGGPLIEKVGAKSGFYIDAISYLLSAVFLFFVKIKYSALKTKTAENQSAEKLRQSIFLDIKEGIKYVISNPYVRFVFFTIFLLMCAAGALYVVGIVFIQHVFGSITRDLGVLSVFLGIGFFLGALLCGRFGNKISKVKIIFLSAIICGFFISCFGLLLKQYPYMPLAMILSVFIGIGVGPIFISGNTLIHEVITAQMRGRIFSSLGIVMNLGFIIFMFVSSKLSEFFNPTWVIIGIGFCFIVYGLLGLIRFKGRLKEFN